MKRLRTTAVVGALLAIVIAPLAYAGGLWFGIPVVGGASYCSGNTATGLTTSGGTTSCNSTVPAGPTTTTGNELIPADLNPQGTPGVPGNANSGVQTGYLPLITGASGAYFLTNPAGLTTSTVTVPNGISNVILNVTGSITNLGVLLPASPFDGQVVNIATAATITTVNITPTTSATIQTTTKPVTLIPLNGANSLTGTTGVSYLFNLSGNTWYRLR